MSGVWTVCRGYAKDVRNRLRAGWSRLPYQPDAEGFIESGWRVMLGGSLHVRLSATRMERP